MTRMRRVACLMGLGTGIARRHRLKLLIGAGLFALVEIAVLGIGSVVAIGAGDGPYSSAVLQNRSMRGGLLTGLVLLTVPLIALVSQLTTLGAAATMRRLALLRLAGATKPAVRVISGTDALLPAALGSIAGACAYYALAPVADHLLRVRGHWTTTVVVADDGLASTEAVQDHVGTVRLLPTDALPSSNWTVVTLVLLPVVAVIFSWLSARRVDARPLSAARVHRRRRPPRRGAALTSAFGLFGLAGFTTIRSLLGQPDSPTRLDVILVVGLFATTAVGVALGLAAFTAACGEWLGRVGRGPAALLAGRRLRADPFAGTRAVSATVLALTVCVAGQAVKEHFLVITDPEDPFYADVLRLVDVAYLLALVMVCCGVILRVVDLVTTRREMYAVQRAMGVPRRTLRRSVLLETLVPLVPGVVVACFIGIVGVRGVLGTAHTRMVQRGHDFVAVDAPIPVPWAQALALGLLVLTVTTVAAAGTFAIAGREDLAEDLRAVR